MREADTRKQGMVGTVVNWKVSLPHLKGATLISRQVGLWTVGLLVLHLVTILGQPEI